MRRIELGVLKLDESWRCGYYLLDITHRRLHEVVDNRLTDDKLDPTVSIVVPVRNAERTLDKTLGYLEMLDYPRERIEVILADGGSTDSTVEVIEKWQRKDSTVKLVEVPNCTSAGHARNAALKVASGEFILFTDGDCAPEPNWVREILRPFGADPAVGGVGGEVLTLRTDADNDTESYCEQVGFLSVAGRCGLTESGYFPGVVDRSPHEVNGGNFSPFFATANVAIRKSVIDEVGGEFWNEPTGEDVDFSLRILEKGHRLYFAKSAVVKHMHRVSLESYMRQWYGYGFGHPLLISRHAAEKFEIVLQFDKPAFISLPLPVKGIVHIGSFQLMHMSLMAAFAAGALSVVNPAVLPFLAASATVLAASALSYFAPCARLRPSDRFLRWCKIRYLSNWAFIKGAVDGTKKFGPVCIEPSW